MLTFKDLIEGLTGNPASVIDQVIVKAVVDSRLVIPGSLFIAVPGEKTDGHDYISQAFENGAIVALVQKRVPLDVPIIDLTCSSSIDFGSNVFPCCILVEDTIQALQKLAAYWRSKLDLRVIGITGSVGKSTTKELVAEVLSNRYKTFKNPGNYNNEIGLPLTILELTPYHECAVLEMGFYVPGEIKFLCDIAKPSIGVVTNIGTVHAERAGSQETIARGKSELIEALPQSGYAILNFDDPYVRIMAENSNAIVFFYGLDPQADLWADQIEGLGLEGIRFRLHFRHEVLTLRIPLLGRHSVHTALRAAAVGLVCGLSWQEIIAGLRFGHTQLRLVVARSQTGALLIDDSYNASPQSTLAALNLLMEMDGRRVAVLGDMLELGQYEETGHQMIGIRCAEVADELITVGERARIIARAAQNAGMPADKITVLDSPEAAVDLLKTGLAQDDVALVKGSYGMRMWTIVPTLEASVNMEELV